MPDPPLQQTAGEATKSTTSSNNKKRKKKKHRKRKQVSAVSEESAAGSLDQGSSPTKRQRLVEDPVSIDPTTDVSALKVAAETKTKQTKKKKRKKDRRQKNGQTAPAPTVDDQSETKAPVKAESTDKSEVSFPFPTDPDDHCESPLGAYAHIQPLLQHLESNMTTKKKNGSSSNLRIYDPYYCNGAVIENLSALGFPNVYNQKEDCYQVWSSIHSGSSTYPDFDVFVTNPPYSGDHIEKLMEHITSPSFGSRPWFLLMPEWVHKKDYFQNLTKSKGIQPFFLVPKKRYVYLPPKDYRDSKKSDVHKKSSPFNSMWYVYGGTRDANEQLMRLYHSKSCTFPVLDAKSSESGAKAEKRLVLSEACDLARSKSALRDLRRKVKKK